MRYLALAVILFTLFFSSATAQTELSKPSFFSIFYYQDSGDCFAIVWHPVDGAANYQVRVTHNGRGWLNYKDTVAEDQRIRNWIDWQELANSFYDFKSLVYFADWCGLAIDQNVKVRVRAVDANGNIGPRSKGFKFYINR